TVGERDGKTWGARTNWDAYLPDSFEFSPEKSHGRSSRTPMRDLFGDSIAGFGEIHEGVRDDVLEIRDFSGHRSTYTEKCLVANWDALRLRADLPLQTAGALVGSQIARQ
ncbi:MAG: hypothetical protein ABEK75_08500, partial [Salinibacter sp.]